jgi:uncharacterized sodium:solute symporter family permease YidK
MNPWKRLPEVSTILLGALVFVYIFLSPIGIVSEQKQVGDLVGPNFKYMLILLLFGMALYYFLIKKKMEKA